MDRIAIIYNEGKLHFFLIDQQDQNIEFSEGLQAAKEQGRDLCIEVHAIRSEFSNPKFGPTDYLEGNGTSVLDEGIPPEIKQQYLRGIVQAKVFVGSIFFNEEENKALKAWLETQSSLIKNNLSQLICKSHSVDRVSQIRGWEKSPLAEYIE